MTVYGPEQYSRYSRYSDELDETRAELDALKAAQGWQPGSIRPPAPDWYQTAEAEDGDGSFSHAYFDGVAWLGYPGNQLVNGE